ncbi:MAG TPA: polyprenyl diphosphate synthase [Candidatus Paceibacterota bacterium]|nr:polyprenyl diphosphate synthase [Candidatus Paceibacterota bacterium]
MEQTTDIQCIGFIMDGNRRWAKARGLTSLVGHQKGYEAIKATIDAVYKAHIPHMVCYAFSTENWNRSVEEVGHIMGLLEKGIRELRIENEARSEKINIHIIGETHRLSQTLQNEIESLKNSHHAEPELSVWIAISYGGRAEIVDAVNRAIAGGEMVTEETFEKFLWTAGMPDPDIIVRTSGEHRISNFLLWQSAYSEFFFIDAYWPDFEEATLRSILEEYGTRVRRKGS